LNGKIIPKGDELLRFAKIVNRTAKNTGIVRSPAVRHHIDEIGILIAGAPIKEGRNVSTSSTVCLSAPSVGRLGQYVRTKR
jgi:hypothetical protein